MKEVKTTDDKIKILRATVLNACDQVFGDDDVIKMISGMAVVSNLLVRDMVRMTDFPNMKKAQKDDMKTHIEQLLNLLQKDITIQKRKIKASYKGMEHDQAKEAKSSNRQNLPSQ